MGSKRETPTVPAMRKALEKDVKYFKETIESANKKIYLEQTIKRMATKALKEAEATLKKSKK